MSDLIRRPTDVKPAPTLRHRWGDEKGLSLILFALMLPVIFGFLGLVVEWGELAEARRQLQTAVDAAALAGAQKLPNQGAATSAANSYFFGTDTQSPNLLASGATPITSFPTGLPAGWTQNPCTDPSNDALCIQVTATKTIPLFIMRYVAGIQSENVSATALAALGSIGVASCPLPIGIVQLGAQGSGNFYGFNNGDYYTFMLATQLGMAGPGNWGYLDFGATGGGMQAIKQEIEGNCGSHGDVPLGPINTKPGTQYNPAMQAFQTRFNGTYVPFPQIVQVISGPDPQYGNYTIGNPATILEPTSQQIVVIPIVDSLKVSGESQTVNIVGFALLVVADNPVTGVKGLDPSNNSFSGYFVDGSVGDVFTIYKGAGPTTVRLIQ